MRLSNGLRLISARTGNVPLTTMTVLIGAGSATDPRAKAGLAGLTAAIASKGTATRNADQIAAALERLGASISSVGRGGRHLHVGHRAGGDAWRGQRRYSPTSSATPASPKRISPANGSARSTASASR